jgi:hypothetical protein
VDAYRTITAELGTNERDAVFRRTAEGCYRI